MGQGQKDIGLGREHTQELLSVSVTHAQWHQERPLLLAVHMPRARERLLCTPRRRQLGLSWPFKWRRVVGITQRRRWPDKRCHQRGERRRGYAAVCCA
eukprot:scaffold116942_cov48-Phaeocystis_antarctica.AAC.2